MRVPPFLPGWMVFIFASVSVRDYYCSNRYYGFMYADAFMLPVVSVGRSSPSNGGGGDARAHHHHHRHTVPTGPFSTKNRGMGRRSMRVRPLVTTSLESATNPYFEGGNRGGGGGEEGVRDDDWMARRTDVRNFLTQRAFQSFIFLLIQCRDPHTVQWLENTYDFQNSESFHGTGFFNLTKWTTWDSLLLDMLHRPSDHVIVSAKRRGRGHGGWSANNPYLPERFVEFRIDIDPVSIVSRIVSVREQIAREWCDDLQTMRMANEMILASYHDTHLSARDDEEWFEMSSRDKSNLEGRDEQNSYPLNEDVEYLIQKRSSAFDRNVTNILLTNSLSFTEQASSPLRQGNFDLLCLLVTQESIHRVLQEYAERGSRQDQSVSHEWFRNFYYARISTYFDGPQKYGRADDFIEELLREPPKVSPIPSSIVGHSGQRNTQMGLIDPLRIAEDLIRMRTRVTKDWQDIVQQVPLDHMTLRRELLNQQMGRGAIPHIGSSSAVHLPESVVESCTGNSPGSNDEAGNGVFQ